MGKLITFISILIFVDILFIVTGQSGWESPTSLVFNGIIDPSGIQDSNWWIVMITGVAGLAIVGSVVAGIVTKSDTLLLFIPFPITR